MRMLRKTSTGVETDLLGVSAQPEDNPVQEMKVIKEILIRLGIVAYAAAVAAVVYFLL